MIEVLITDIRRRAEAEHMHSLLENIFPGLKTSIDLEETAKAFPCGHSVLRAEGAAIDTAAIISMVNKAGFQCMVLADKICS